MNTTGLRLGLALAVSLGGSAHGACPGSICDCLGEAGKFNVVATRSIRTGVARLGYAPYLYPIETYFEEACAPTARLKAHSSYAPSTAAGD